MDAKYVCMLGYSLQLPVMILQLVQSTIFSKDGRS